MQIAAIKIASNMAARRNFFWDHFGWELCNRACYYAIENFPGGTKITITETYLFIDINHMNILYNAVYMVLLGINLLEFCLIKTKSRRLTNI